MAQSVLTNRGNAHPREITGLLVFFAGGMPSEVARAKPVLLDMGATVHHTGATGSGMAIKLAVNGLLAIQVAAMAELVEMLARQELDPVAALAIVASTPVCSPAARIAGEMMISDAFAPMFPVNLVQKDLVYAVGAAGVARAPLMDAARARFQEAADKGYGEQHLTAVVRTLRGDKDGDLRHQGP